MPNEMPLSVNSNAECVAIYSSNNISNNSTGQRIKQNENKIKWRVAYTHFALSFMLPMPDWLLATLSRIRSLAFALFPLSPFCCYALPACALLAFINCYCYLLGRALIESRPIGCGSPLRCF